MNNPAPPPPAPPPAPDDAERTRCEVWTRVMGYHRPVAAFNAGKGAEHRDRVYFREMQPGARVRHA
jgi:hypothetical protein